VTKSLFLLLFHINSRGILKDIFENKKEYPVIKNFCKNSYYSGILQNLYSGSEGETVIFLQLRYHSYILQRFNDLISQSLKDISKTI